MPICSGSIPSKAERLSRMREAWGPIFGCARIRVESTFAIRYPAVFTRCSASRKNTAESAPFHCGSDGENNVPMSGAATAPSRASVMACSKTSPSECPPRPLGCSMLTPPILRGTPALNSCESQPYPIRCCGAFVFGLIVRKNCAQTRCVTNDLCLRTVYVKKNHSAYNFRMHVTQQGSSAVRFPRCKYLVTPFAVALAALAFATSAFAQQPAPSAEVTVTTKDLPAGLWNHYSFKLEATGGVGPYTWHLLSGKLPRKLEFRDFGMIDGTVDEQGTFELTLEAVDRAGARSKPKKLTLTVEP